MTTEDCLARAHYHLQGWAEYCRICQGHTSKGYPIRSAFLSTGGNSADFDDMVTEADFAVARTCDAVISELEEIHQEIIKSAYLIKSVIKHDRIPFSVLLESAQSAFWAKARKWLI